MSNFAPSSRIVIVLLAIASAPLIGCGFTQSKTEAEAVLARHFQAIGSGSFDTAIEDYGVQFFQQTSKDDWLKVLGKVSGKLGKYQNHTVTSWRVFTNASTTGAGTTVTIQCEVSYSKHSATENFTLYKGLADSDYKIVGHNINSMALLTE